MLIPVITNRLVKALLRRPVSFIPKAKPIPIMGPISGDISIAPIITGMELTFNPTLAIIIATARIHTFGPLNEMFEIMDACAAFISICSVILVISFILLKNPIPKN